MRSNPVAPLALLLGLAIFARKSRAQVVLVEDFEFPDTTNLITYVAVAPQQIETSSNT